MIFKGHNNFHLQYRLHNQSFPSIELVEWLSSTEFHFTQNSGTAVTYIKEWQKLIALGHTSLWYYTGRVEDDVHYAASCTAGKKNA